MVKEWREQPFISLAVLRVYKLAQVIEFPYEKKFGGCRSWLDVPVFNEDHIQSSQPVIEDQKFEILFSQLKERLELSSALFSLANYRSKKDRKALVLQ